MPLDKRPESNLRSGNQTVQPHVAIPQPAARLVATHHPLLLELDGWKIP